MPGERGIDQLSPIIEDMKLDIRAHSDVVTDPEHIYHRWNRVFQEADEKMGKTFKIAIGSRMRDLMGEGAS
ncbi:hypothetical protein B0I35DRAFT_482985 [Stachybotrys elegans]|uniref:Uncharacterized protein n=1 Tax=Stachybotrys elegans TaxID=80388 RepID=A0A8K0SKM3_9HYPO|nr:hypothetical protein B0I35DRAFT_482985 [Stachybotrys elegans]